MLKDGVTTLTLLFYALQANAWFFLTSALLLLLSPTWLGSLQVIGVIVAYRLDYMLGLMLQSILLLYMFATPS